MIACIYITIEIQSWKFMVIWYPVSLNIVLKRAMEAATIRLIALSD